MLVKTGKSNLNQFELFLARAAFWANPISWQIGPACACWYTVFGVALGFVINPAANHTGIAFEIVIAHCLLSIGRGKIFIISA